MGGGELSAKFVVFCISTLFSGSKFLGAPQAPKGSPALSRDSLGVFDVLSSNLATGRSTDIGT